MANKPKSSKTTIGGVIALVGLVAAGLAALLDKNAATNPDYTGIFESLQGLGLLTGAVGAAVAGFFGRDNDVSSEGRKLE